MQTTIQKLQKKSEAEKVAIALFSAITITAVLFIGWGYNFAHSGKVSNLASGAAGVATVVEDSRIQESFNDALAEFKKLNIFNDATEQSETSNTEKDIKESVSRKHINVFATQEAFENGNQATPLQQNYGENGGDVLY